VTDKSAEISPIVVGFAGMTHLGVVSAASVSAKGFPTVCYDQNEAVIEKLSRGAPPISEPGLDELIAVNGTRHSFTSDLAALGRCDVVYISVDVPTDDYGRSDLRDIEGLIARVAGAMREDSVLVILCQVPPGFTRAVEVIPQHRLYYQVETLVFGRAVERALRPERTILGLADPAAPLDARYAAVLAAFGCPLLPMRYESAELAKIAINCCLVSSISIANTLSEICESTGAEWSEIVPALKLDARIGPGAYLAPGLGIAGGNLERDLATILVLSDRHHTNSDVVRAWISNSRHRRDWAFRTITSALLARAPDARVAVWGLAYKENTHSIKNSPSLAMIAALPAATQLTVHDPVVRANVIGRSNVDEASDPLSALEGAEALMIMTPWQAYRAVPPHEIASRMRGRIVVDPYRVLDPAAAKAAGLDYHTLGSPHVSPRETA
jgi:UDPglucose 6-dehydrogenase